MKQLNKKQRHELYKEVYTLFLSLKYEFRQEKYLCIIFDDFIEGGYSDWDNKVILPEFESFKPDEEDMRDAWLSHYYDNDNTAIHELNNNLRETVLLFCIEMTK